MTLFEYGHAIPKIGTLVVVTMLTGCLGTSGGTLKPVIIPDDGRVYVVPKDDLADDPADVVDVVVAIVTATTTTTTASTTN